MTSPLSNDSDVSVLAQLGEDAGLNLDPRDKHHMRLRKIAVSVAVVTIVAMGILEYCIVSNISHWEKMGDWLVFWAIAPIISITVIVTFLLIGAFRSSSGPQIENPSNAQVGLGSVAEIVGKSVAGNGG